MSARAAPASDREVDLSRMREEFDRGFTKEPLARDVEVEGVLSIRVAATRYVVRCSEISGVAVAGKISGVPSRTPGLQGVTGIRGALVPVFSLATLLAEPPSEDAASWFLLVGRDEPLAFAFHGIAAYRSVEHGLNSPIQETGRTRPYLREVMTWGTELVPVIHVPSLVSVVRAGAEPRRGKEGE